MSLADNRAVILFNADHSTREMHISEFEATLDRYVPIHDLCNQEKKAVYVECDDQLHPLSMVFFLIRFDDDGFPDFSWNLPLEQLAANGAPGPDLGGGPIRLCCQSQCNIEWHKELLWNPKLAINGVHFQAILNALSINRIGLLKSDPADVPNAKPGLQQTSASELKKQYQQQLETLKSAHEQALQKIKRKSRQLIERARQETAQLQQSLARSSQHREYEIAHSHAKDVSQSDVIASHKEQYLLCQLDLIYRQSETDALSSEVVRLQESRAALMANSGNKLLKKLQQSGINFVSFQPGCGHMSIPLNRIGDYVDSPLAYAAQRCGVPLARYEIWLEHYRQPRCRHSNEFGQRCGELVTQVENPADFVPGKHDHCLKHRRN